MIHIKNEKEIAIMVKAGKILADVLATVIAAAKPGITELELDAMAEKMIRERGGEPGFQKVPGYKHTICAATNDVVVHGIPTTYVLKEGDVICVDCGVFLEGFHTDMAETVRVTSKKTDKQDDINTFLAVGKKALIEAIAAAKPGNRVGHIAKTIQDIVEKEAGYSIIRTLVGHGVGKQLHEEPEVPGFLRGKIEKTPLLKEGMTIAIEVIYAIGGKDVVYANDDGWTIATADGSVSAVFERTVLITKNGSRVLTSV